MNILMYCWHTHSFWQVPNQLSLNTGATYEWKLHERFFKTIYILFSHPRKSVSASITQVKKKKKNSDCRQATHKHFFFIAHTFYSRSGEVGWGGGDVKEKPSTFFTPTTITSMPMVIRVKLIMEAQQIYFYNTLLHLKYITFIFLNLQSPVD